MSIRSNINMLPSTLILTAALAGSQDLGKPGSGLSGYATGASWVPAALLRGYGNPIMSMLDGGVQSRVCSSMLPLPP